VDGLEPPTSNSSPSARSSTRSPRPKDLSQRHRSRASASDRPLDTLICGFGLPGDHRSSTCSRNVDNARSMPATRELVRSRQACSKDADPG
jgi:hypothetical protein